MILDLPKFIESARPNWAELEAMLKRIEEYPHDRLTLPQAQRLHFLYEKSASDLSRLSTFSAEPEMTRYLQTLVARAYAELHESRTRGGRWNAWTWFTRTLPQTFRRHAAAFWLSTLITLVGTLFGGVAHFVDPEAKETIMPSQFANHLGDPSKRVKAEESAKQDRMKGHKQAFAAHLMANNIRVSINAFALGLTYAVGTIVLLFYNGVILGLVGLDYILAGESVFLAAWLLPHGSIEIPSILLAGQAGLILGKKLIGDGSRRSLRARLREAAPDLATIMGGVAIFLVWAGIVESFFSQYHAPVLPYWLKISFGCVELAALIWFLGWCGREKGKGK